MTSRLYGELHLTLHRMNWPLNVCSTIFSHHQVAPSEVPRSDVLQNFTNVEESIYVFISRHPPNSVAVLLPEVDLVR